jgi:hypothetical protein
MKITFKILALAALLPAGAALADDDDCFAPRAQWQPMANAQQLAVERGWTVRELKIDDGCYEIEGRDADGRRIEVKLDPATLAVVEMEWYADKRPLAARNAPQDAPLGAPGAN